MFYLNFSKVKFLKKKYLTINKNFMYNNSKEDLG